MTAPHAAAASRSWVIENEKVTAYLLNLSHPKGRSKARLLIQLGFCPAQPAALVHALARHAMSNGPGREMHPPIGLSRLIINGPLEAPGGRFVNMRTVWEQTTVDEAQFITLYPLPA